MEFLAKAAFVFYVLVIAGGSLAAALSHNMVRALLGLILTMFGVAGMYMLLNAPFVALMQVLVYVGAVAVLVFFAIMLTRTPTGGEESQPNPSRKYLLALLTAMLPGAALGWVWLKHPVLSDVTPVQAPMEALGQGLMEPYILAFELISVVLFVAMSGAVILAFRKRGS
ncbi:NADH-quinone oxidoreductase subunit J [Desulfocurvibacter africanus]|uniref:NADH-quinone oxidoreductase subunit J n=1 Tax=Desulfocurvibacter africanus subsp. africanus str. Walvis Bay TaxID=690850 RepID=F3Z159_DESAF|nr:NADH-quinone oxidoreductase subunit J [Desulfocurvibacter africanus]EGJ49957.1 NADH-ubiquinone/plastoquinone oxidoreductase chain 6 [Desulfocurvibacter africanus subsp. africanus str. Walvis Bay]